MGIGRKLSPLESVTPGAIECYHETDGKVIYALLECLCEDYGNVEPKKWLEPYSNLEGQAYLEEYCYFFIFLRDDVVLGYFALEHIENYEFFAHFYNFRDVSPLLWYWLLKKGLQLCHTVGTRKMIFNLNGDPKMERIVKILGAKQTGEKQWEIHLKAPNPIHHKNQSQ